MNKTISLLIRRTMVPLLLVVYSFTYAQKQPAAQVMISNDTLLNAKTYQFDVFVKASDANGINSFDLKGFQGGFEQNLKNVKGNGTVTATVVAGSSDFKSNAEQVPTVALIKPNAKNPNYIVLNPAVLKTNGIKITNSGWVKVCTIKLTNTVDFQQSTMMLNFSKKAIYPTVVMANFKKSAISNGALSFDSFNKTYNPILNKPLTKFNVKNIDGSVGLDGSELQCAYKLVLNGVVQNETEIVGTGGPIVWENVQSGAYTVVGRRIATYLKSEMNGSIVATNNSDINSNYITYPNPVIDQFSIESKGISGESTFTVYNSIGQEVYKGTIVGKTVVHTSNYAPGVYLIKIENGNVSEYKKIVKK